MRPMLQDLRLAPMAAMAMGNPSENDLQMEAGPSTSIHQKNTVGGAHPVMFIGL